MECFGTTDFDNIIRDYNKRPPLYMQGIQVEELGTIVTLPRTYTSNK
jgi:hypothetical protein